MEMAGRAYVIILIIITIIQSKIHKLKLIFIIKWNVSFVPV